MFAAVGADASYGTQLVHQLEAAGFEQIGGELRAPIVSGGSEQWTRGTAEQLADHFVRTGLATADDLSCFLRISDERSVHYATPCMATAWGRRPDDLNPPC